ncbi:MAG: hypothetical protein JWR52_1673 [Marmoricola sp.]|nr:hypothetical protein [Marmoricola sp.]
MRRVRRRGPGRWAWGVAVVALAVVWTASSGTLSSWNAGVVLNSANSSLTGSLAVTHTYQATSCSLTARVAGTTSCGGSIGPTVAATVGGVSATDTFTNNSPLSASQLTSEFRAPSCAPVKFANVKTSTDPLLPRYAVAFGQTDKWGTSSAAALSGGSAYASDVVATNTASLLGGSYAFGVWFKVANAYASGGGLLSMATSAVDTSSVAGTPLLWMDNAGKIRFRISGTLGSTTSGVSAAAYNDGNWHLAVLSVASVIVSTPTLYVDNAAGVSASGLTALTGGNAYWHAGWGDFTGVSNSPTSAYLTGSLSGAFVAGNSVSSGTVSSLFTAASAAAYSTAAQALSGASQVWMLDDTGTTTYAGSLPTIGATSACSMVDLAWTFTSPSGTASAAGTKLSTFANGTWHTVTAPGAGGSQTSTVTLTRDATWNAYVAGLHLYAPLSQRLSAPPASSWTAILTWDGATGVFIS